MKVKQLDVLRTSFRAIEKFPDPTQIDTSGKWYFLNHISSPLLVYDHNLSSFKPLIASSWSTENESEISIALDAGAKFSDGRLIKASDVAATIKRILVNRTSTHFPLWKQIMGSESLRSMEDTCSGLSFSDEKKSLKIKLRAKNSSFLLQISSPECGIWSAEDISRDGSLTPTKYSGPYELEDIEMNSNREFVLNRNENSFLQRDFPHSPKKIVIQSLDRSGIENAMVGGTSDIFIGDFIPCNEFDWDSLEFNVQYGAPSSVVYFFGLNSKKKIGLDLLEALKNVSERRFQVADTFLPFSPEISVKKRDFMNFLPEKSFESAKIAAPGYYFKRRFLEQLKSFSLGAGITLEIVEVDRAEYVKLLNSADDFRCQYDFLLGTHVCSEKYPAGQLRFLTGGRTPQVDLSDIEQSDQDLRRIKRFREYQIWLLESQIVVPAFFARSHIVSKPQIDIGDQSKTEADIHLWKVTGRAAPLY